MAKRGDRLAKLERVQRERYRREKVTSADRGGQVARRFESYEEFWPSYVAEHSDPTCRAMHFVGTRAALAALAAGIIVSRWWLAAAPVTGYVFAWVGHFVFEKNRPDTFHYPLWSRCAPTSACTATCGSAAWVKKSRGGDDANDCRQLVLS